MAQSKRNSCRSLIPADASDHLRHSRIGNEISDTKTPPLTDYPSLLRLDGRIAVVLGGGFGIGRETCIALAQAGARVYCVDLDASRAEAMAAR